MDELLRELRMKTPDEIKRYQKIIANKDAIPVSYTHLDVYKRQPVDGQTVFEKDDF